VAWAVAAALLLAAPALWAQAAPVARDDFKENILRVFADDAMADVRVIFGYDDSQDFHDPFDPTRASNLMAYLVEHGFEPVPITTELAGELGVPLAAPNLRVFVGPGAPRQTLRVALIWSSATSSTLLNIGSGRNLQLRCSYEALSFMQKAAADAEVQVYLGHSRAGGGPDTFPPVTRQNFVGNRQRVNYSHYTGSQPGLASLGSHFKRARERPAIIAWTSCATDRHFKRWFERTLSAKTGATSILLSTRLAYRIPHEVTIEGYDEGLMATVQLIKALQVHGSTGEFQRDLLACEMDARRDPLKPLWKLVWLQGAGKKLARE
jgi:hypothetical protein